MTGFVVILLAAAVVFLLLRGSGPRLSPPLQDTETPAPAATSTLAPTATGTPLPAETPPPLPSEAPVLEETPSSAGTSTYEVQEGDTLATIAERFNIDFQALLSLNPGIDPDLIVVGQQIVIPAAGSAASTATSIPEGLGGLVEYQVVSGDTLLDIANRFNSSVAAIVAENNLENANDIQAGDVLQIPSNVTELEPEDSTSTPEAIATPLLTETPNP